MSKFKEFYYDSLEETIIRKKVIRDGKLKTIPVTDKEGYKIVRDPLSKAPKEERMSSDEKKKRKKGQGKGSKERKKKETFAQRKRKISIIKKQSVS